MTTVKMSNRGLFVTTVTYISIHGPKGVILKGGETLEVENTASNENPDLPNNILNLPVEDDIIVKTDFKFDKDNVSVKITQS